MKLPRLPKPRRLAEEVTEWWVYLGWKQVLGYLSALGGIGLTIATALTKGPNQLLIAVIAVFAQGIAAFLFAGQGRAQPAYAKRAVARLLRLAARADRATKSASDNFEDKSLTPTRRRDDIGRLSVELSWITEGLSDAVADWIEINQPLIELIDKQRRHDLLVGAHGSKPAVESDSLTQSQLDEVVIQIAKQFTA